MVQLLLPIIYISFISLGLPDSLLGSAWPSMYPVLGVPVSYAGLISMIISFGTIVSSLNSDRLTRALGTGKVTALSVAMTTAALFGFSVSTQFWMLCLWAVPYGLGAGSVDAALNNYVALHYKSRHMSWLHCMWGVGASVGPYIMGYALSQGQGWPWGYRYIAILQVMLTVILVLSLPLWKKRGAIAVGESTDDTASSDGNAERFGTAEGVSVAERKPLGVAGVLAIRGAKEILVMFFCYCAVESTAGLWASSYMVMHSGIDKITAASWASLFYVGITVGRALSGFLTMRFKDPVMIRLGQVLVFAGILTMFVPLPHHLGVVVADRPGLRPYLPVRHPLDAGLLRRRQIAGHRRRADGLRLCGLTAHAATVRHHRAICDNQSLPVVFAGALGADGGHARASSQVARLIICAFGPDAYYAWSPW